MKEVTYSKKAEELGIKNIPSESELEMAKLLADTILEPARDIIGSPISVNSWFRNKETNRAVDGSKTSDHQNGGAVDLTTKNKKNNALLFDILRYNGGFDQLIYEHGNDERPDWIHVSIRKTGNRGEVLRARKNSKGKTYFEHI